MKILFFYFEKSDIIFPDIVLLLRFLFCRLFIFFITNAAVIIFIIVVLLILLSVYSYDDLNYTRAVSYRAIADIYTERLLLATENTIEYSH